MAADNAQLVADAFVQVWRDGDLSAISDDYVDHDHAPNVPPTKEGLAQLREMTLEGFPDFAVRVERVVAEGDYVAAQVTNSGTQSGTFMGVPPTGKKATWGGMAIFRIQGGKIIERWGVIDRLGLMQQLGVLG